MKINGRAFGTFTIPENLMVMIDLMMMIDSTKWGTTDGWSSKTMKPSQCLRPREM